MPIYGRILPMGGNAMSKDYWSWCGKYIGFSINNILFSKKGTPIGYFANNILFDFSGKYLAEVLKNIRLIVFPSHKSHIGNSLTPPIKQAGRNVGDKNGEIMISGCQDFTFDE